VTYQSRCRRHATPRPLTDTPYVRNELHISHELYKSHRSDMPRPQVDDSEPQTMCKLRESRTTNYIRVKWHATPSHRYPICESRTTYKSRTTYIWGMNRYCLPSGRHLYVWLSCESRTLYKSYESRTKISVSWVTNYVYMSHEPPSFVLRETAICMCVCTRERECARERACRRVREREHVCVCKKDHTLWHTSLLHMWVTDCIYVTNYLRVTYETCHALT